MKRILIYPTHRRLIRILRNKTINGKYLVVQIENYDEINKILKDKNLNSYEKHQKLYRCCFKINMENPNPENCVFLNINKIQDYICEIERNSLLRTIRNTLIYYISPVLIKMLKL